MVPAQCAQGDESFMGGLLADATAFARSNGTEPAELCNQDTPARFLIAMQQLSWTSVTYRLRFYITLV
jgi:hypothetical protein